MRTVIHVIMLCAVSLVWGQTVLGEPAWTRTGDCQSCHTDVRPGLITVFGNNGTFDPDGAGPLSAQKAFRFQRGQTNAQLTAQLAGLSPGDTYAVALNHLDSPGVTKSAALDYGSDCAWTDWVSNWDHVYSDPTRKYDWGIGPSVSTFNIMISATAAYECYDLAFSVAGVEQSTRALVYAEEHFYLRVTAPNVAPSVAITHPVSNEAFNASSRIVIAADASDTDGTIAKVEFFQGATKLGESLAAPYAYAWDNVPAGNYVLTAKATDDSDASTTSTAVNFLVRAQVHVPGDFDQDGDVDQSDFGHLQACVTGTGVAQNAPACLDALLDADTDVDQDDVGLFQRCASGPNIAGDPNCAQ